MLHAKRATKDNRKNPEYHVVAAIRKLRTDKIRPAEKSKVPIITAPEKFENTAYFLQFDWLRTNKLSQVNQERFVNANGSMASFPFFAAEFLPPTFKDKVKQMKLFQVCIFVSFCLSSKQ